MSADGLLELGALNRLKWRCRRGLLENDLFIQRFFQRHESSLTEAQARGLQALMELSDNDLLDLLLVRTQPRGELDVPEVNEVLGLMRTPSRSAAGRSDRF
jgi:antitoxin CptB